MSTRLLSAEFRRCTLVFCAVLLAGSFASAQTSNTRLLRTPTVSATQIAFAYAQNIWVAPRAGGVARRVTSFQGQTTNPHFSPDGKWIAFSGEYAGNFDVYVVAAEGGEPKRLTWHPGADTVQGWTPDGRSILFSSRVSRQNLRRRNTHRLSHEQFVGRRAPQLSRRSESPRLDRRS